jgi:hypothetical protein
VDTVDRRDRGSVGPFREPVEGHVGGRVKTG